jgi:hypothetical protein
MPEMQRERSSAVQHEVLGNSTKLVPETPLRRRQDVEAGAECLGHLSRKFYPERTSEASTFKGCDVQAGTPRQSKGGLPGEAAAGTSSQPHSCLVLRPLLLGANR